jgi:hypothetical protein
MYGKIRFSLILTTFCSIVRPNMAEQLYSNTLLFEEPKETSEPAMQTYRYVLQTAKWTVVSSTNATYVYYPPNNTINHTIHPVCGLLPGKHQHTGYRDGSSGGLGLEHVADLDMKIADGCLYHWLAINAFALCMMIAYVEQLAIFFEEARLDRIAEEELQDQARRQTSLRNADQQMDVNTEDAEDAADADTFLGAFEILL